MHPALKRTLTVIKALIESWLILVFGQLTWTLLVIANRKTGITIPWSAPVMAVILWLMWKYLGGAWWPRRTANRRAQYLRSRTVPRAVFAQSMLAGLLGVVAIAGYWIVMFDLFPMGPNVLPKTDGYPLWIVAPLLIMSSLVSPFTEEAAFRGYCQVMLEREFRATTAILITSVYFALAHFTHGAYLPKLSAYFLAGIVFSLIAYLTNSTLPALPVHILGDLTFFIFIWPHDATRKLLSEGGSITWFWVHVAQAAIFTCLTIVAFRKLAKMTGQERARDVESSREPIEMRAAEH